MRYQDIVRKHTDIDLSTALHHASFPLLSCHSTVFHICYCKVPTFAKFLCAIHASCGMGGRALFPSKLREMEQRGVDAVERAMAQRAQYTVYEYR